MQEQKQQVKEAATAVAEEKGKQVAQDVLAGKKPEEAINNLFKKDTTKAAVPADSTKTDLKQETQKALENKLQNLLKKKKNN